MNLDVPQVSASPARSAKRVLAIAGSLRSGSWNLRLLQAAVDTAPAGMTISVYRDLALIPFFDEDLEHTAEGGPDPVRRLRQQVESADAVLISTPEYNQSMPGVLKNMIDWMSRAAPHEVLQGKPVALVGASSGRWGTRLAQQAMRHSLIATEALVMPSPMLFVANAPDLFDEAGRLRDGPTKVSLQAVLDSLAKWIDLVTPLRRGSGAA